MLLEFSVRNFKSLAEGQSFSMVPGKFITHKDHLIDVDKVKALKLAAIYGANAAGKSNFVDVFRYVKSLVKRGNVVRSNKTISNKNSQDLYNSSTEFEFYIYIDNTIYKYGLSVSYTKNQLIREYLYVVKNKKEKLVYDIDFASGTYNTLPTGKHRSNKAAYEVFLSESIKKGTLVFLSKIGTFDVDYLDWFSQSIRNVYEWFTEKLRIITPDASLVNLPGFITTSCSDERVPLKEFLSSFDTGITDIINITMSYEDLLKKLATIYGEDGPLLNGVRERVDELDVDEGFTFTLLDHIYSVTRYENIIQAEYSTFKHGEGSDFDFGYNEESDGTQRLLNLVSVLYSSQCDNQVFIIDELDRSLHPNLTTKFIENFVSLSRSTNSQMIFTTHENTLMNLNYLRQDEIWLVDKSNEGNSSLVPLSSFDIRSDKVINRSYLDGRYGGVPYIKSILESEDMCDTDITIQ